jgi:hypothetical protein
MVLRITIIDVLNFAESGILCLIIRFFVCICQTTVTSTVAYSVNMLGKMYIVVAHNGNDLVIFEQCSFTFLSKCYISEDGLYHLNILLPES